MGWFGGWFSSGDDHGEADPLRKLDPQLRDFLQRESPVGAKPPIPPTTLPPPQPAALARSRPAVARPASVGAAADTDRAPGPVPQESLYQDGRYAHLWKNYKPLAAVEAENKSDHEKLMDVLDDFKERKAQIGRAALENCADEQLDWRACMTGDITARLTMCRHEVRKFERCFSMQSRLLKSLGYLSVAGRSTQVDEDIQMHADTIYHKMLDQEAAIDAAKAEGKPAPVFPSLIPKPTVTAGEDEDLRVDADVRKKWQKQLDKVPEEDRPAEEDALKAERRAQLEMSTRIQSIWDEQAKDRETRREKGDGSLLDKVSGVFGKK